MEQREIDRFGKMIAKAAKRVTADVVVNAHLGRAAAADVTHRLISTAERGEHGMDTAGRASLLIAETPKTEPTWTCPCGRPLDPYTGQLLICRVHDNNRRVQAIAAWLRRIDGAAPDVIDHMLDAFIDSAAE